MPGYYFENYLVKIVIEPGPPPVSIYDMTIEKCPMLTGCIDCIYCPDCSFSGDNALFKCATC